LIVAFVGLATGWPAGASAAKPVLMTTRGHAAPAFHISVSSTSRPGWGTPGVEPSTSATGRSSQRTVRGVLAHLAHAGEIPRSVYAADLGAFNAALREVNALPAARADELEAVIENLHQIAVDGALTPSRLPVLFLTLDRNRQYWRTGPLLSYGQRVEFPGSALEWEYYPGQGIELQVLGSFSEAVALCNARPGEETACQQLLAELIPLAVHRAGGLVWEYYFRFDGGTPPWTSAMSQATALQALAEAYKELRDPEYLTVGQQALAVFSRPPPAGVGEATDLGMRFVQYSFAPARGYEVINAFLQTLIGLDDFAQTTGNPTAESLFQRGNREAQAELPQFNTGAWSLYQPGIEDDLSYHELVTEFLQQLCSLTKVSVYCQTATAFQLDLKTPPVLSLVTRRVKARRATDIYFTVSKISRVGITILRNGVPVFLTSASFPHGQHDFSIPALKPTGSYSVKLDATDLAGNFADTAATPLTVSR
jgi:hypothetical protein